MSRDLEALLEALHALKEAPAREVEAYETRYQSRLQEVSSRVKLDEQRLHRMILRKYGAWLRATNNPTSLPPKA